MNDPAKDSEPVTFDGVIQSIKTSLRLNPYSRYTVRFGRNSTAEAFRVYLNRFSSIRTKVNVEAAPWVNPGEVAISTLTSTKHMVMGDY